LVIDVSVRLPYGRFALAVGAATGSVRASPVTISVPRDGIRLPVVVTSLRLVYLRLALTAVEVAADS
jgi:hypothetical protein